MFGPNDSTTSGLTGNVDLENERLVVPLLRGNNVAFVRRSGFRRSRRESIDEISQRFLFLRRQLSLVAVQKREFLQQLRREDDSEARAFADVDPVVAVRKTEIGARIDPSF